MMKPHLPTVSLCEMVEVLVRQSFHFQLPPFLVVVVVVAVVVVAPTQGRVPTRWGGP